MKGAYTMKKRRHAVILDIITDEEILTQFRLTDELRKRGYDVTQATVSRDIKELGLVKVPCGGNRYKYILPQSPTYASTKHVSIFSQSVVRIDRAVHTIVIKTLPGTASAAASAIDSAFGVNMLGCIAGDDTILVVTKSEHAAAELEGKLTEMRAGRL